MLDSCFFFLNIHFLCHCTETRGFCEVTELFIFFLYGSAWDLWPAHGRSSETTRGQHTLHCSAITLTSIFLILVDCFEETIHIFLLTNTSCKAVFWVYVSISHVSHVADAYILLRDVLPGCPVGIHTVSRLNSCFPAQACSSLSVLSLGSWLPGHLVVMTRVLVLSSLLCSCISPALLLTLAVASPSCSQLLHCGSQGLSCLPGQL